MSETELTFEQFVWFNLIVDHVYQTRGQWHLDRNLIRTKKPIWGHCPITSFANKHGWDAGDYKLAATWLRMPDDIQQTIADAADGVGFHDPLVAPLRGALQWAMSREPVQVL